MTTTKMSLDKTSHPGRTGTDELVPSRYALRVGEIDVLVISDGVLPLPTTMLGHNADPAVRAAWLDDMFLPPDAFDWALNVVVVRSGGRTILIDAGLGGVDSKDSLLGANQIQDCFWGGSLGCDGPVGFERRGVGADGAADHRSA